MEIGMILGLLFITFAIFLVLVVIGAEIENWHKDWMRRGK